MSEIPKLLEMSDKYALYSVPVYEKGELVDWWDVRIGDKWEGDPLMLRIVKGEDS